MASAGRRDPCGLVGGPKRACPSWAAPTPPSTRSCTSSSRSHRGDRPHHPRGDRCRLAPAHFEPLLGAACLYATPEHRIPPCTALVADPTVGTSNGSRIAAAIRPRRSRHPTEGAGLVPGRRQWRDADASATPPSAARSSPVGRDHHGRLTRSSEPWESYAQRRLRQLARQCGADNIFPLDPRHPDAWMVLQIAVGEPDQSGSSTR